jgi:hypothetical protein
MSVWLDEADGHDRGCPHHPQTELGDIESRGAAHAALRADCGGARLYAAT